MSFEEMARRFNSTPPIVMDVCCFVDSCFSLLKQILKLE